MTDEEYYDLKSTLKEEWKQLFLDDELQNYDVSNTGKIRNHETKKEYKLSEIYGMKNHYEFITLKLNSGDTRFMGIHRLIGIMFIPIPKKYIDKGYSINDLVIDHIDNIKYHNIITNLQWLTGAENIQKSRKILKGKVDMYLTDFDVKNICKSLSDGLTIYEVSKKFNVTETMVYDIRFGRRYKEISSNYIFPSRQLSEEDVKKICELLSKGISSRKISDKYGYSLYVLTQILCRI